MNNPTYLAQQLNINGNTIQGPQGFAFNNVGDVLNAVSLFLYPFAGVVLLFIFLWAGYDFVTSQGEQEKISSARMKMTAGIIGFTLLVLSAFFVQVIGFVFGLNEFGIF